MTYRDRQRGVVAIGFSTLMALGCAPAGRGLDEWAGPIETMRPSTGSLAESAEARAVVGGVRARFRWAERPVPEMAPAQEPRSDSSESSPVLLPSPADRIDLDGAWLRPHLPAASVRGVAHRARVALPRRANGPFELADEDSGMVIEVSLAGATDVPAEAAGGFVVYRAGHPSGADLLHRPTAEGTEDYLAFERAPGVEAIEYELVLRDNVAGLRLVENTLELLDAAGVPRLRMAPPYVVDSNGERHNATVALRGCAFDADPRPPWGRAVTAPGAARCTVHVGWAGAELRYPVLLDPMWTATGFMMSVHAYHTASVLQDGRVLVAGGLWNDSIATAEVYDPASDTWSITASMAIPRDNHTAGVLLNGKVLVAGGRNSGPWLMDAEVYDPSSGTWSATGSMAVTRKYHTATVLTDGRVLVVGGTFASSSNAEVYDPISGAWTATGDMVTPLRFSHAASILPNGNVLVSGGWPLPGPQYIAAAEVYDPISNAWSATGSMGGGRAFHAASLLWSGKVLVAGGNDGLVALASAELYDPTSGTWTTTGSMASARSAPLAMRLNGEVLVAGGDSNGGYGAEIYDPASGTWTTTTNLTTGRGNHTASVLLDGRVLVASGYTAELFGLPLGAACTLPDDSCASGFCTDGVCCNGACDGACAVCAASLGAVADGTCTPVQAGSAGTPSCGAYLCDGISETCPMTCANDGHCDPSSYCASNSTCQPDQPNGAPCTAPSQCVSGLCEAGACTDGSGGTGGWGGSVPSGSGASGSAGSGGSVPSGSGGSSGWGGSITSGSGGSNDHSGGSGDPTGEAAGCGCRAAGARDQAPARAGFSVLALLAMTWFFRRRQSRAFLLHSCACDDAVGKSV